MDHFDSSIDSILRDAPEAALSDPFPCIQHTLVRWIHFLRNRLNTFFHLKTNTLHCKEGIRLVGLAGLEPATSTSRTWRASQLRYSPMFRFLLTNLAERCDTSVLAPPPPEADVPMASKGGSASGGNCATARLLFFFWSDGNVPKPKRIGKGRIALPYHQNNPVS